MCNETFIICSLNCLIKNVSVADPFLHLSLRKQVCLRTRRMKKLGGREDFMDVVDLQAAVLLAPLVQMSGKHSLKTLGLNVKLFIDIVSVYCMVGAV